MYFVYVLKSYKNGKYYIGQTKDLSKRIQEHNSNNNKKQFTANNGPWRLLFYEKFITRSDAIKQEKFLKSGRGREYIRSKDDSCNKNRD